MIIYNPRNEALLAQRLTAVQSILNSISAKHCFITGSFLFKESYGDIDIFVISRTKKKLNISDKKAKVAVIDFNDMHSLFYHSISKSCVAKNLLPVKPLKVTISDYWRVVNEAIPELLNNKNNGKVVRSLVLYTEYFRTKTVLDSFELDAKLKHFKSSKDILEYLRREIPKALNSLAEFSYLKRFFYTQSGFYSGLSEYKAQRYLFDLCHEILAYGRSNNIQKKSSKNTGPRVSS